MAATVSVCFVCLGNICRSPTAAAIMRQLVDRAGLANEIAIDSAGVSGAHAGEDADPRTRECAEARGLKMRHRARKFDDIDFARFDYVVAMDRNNFAALERQARDPTHRAKLHMLRSFDKASSPNAEVPDPYYGGARGFDNVYDICEAACHGLLDELVRKYGFQTNQR